MADNKLKKIAIAWLASILVMAMVVTVAVGDKDNTGDINIHTSNKVVKALCLASNHKETCEESLSGAKSKDPKELLKIGFEKTINSLKHAIKNSTAYKEAEADERTKGALCVCEEVLNTAIEDMRRSFDKVEQVELSKIDDLVEDVKTWLSGALTYHETCLDAFENTTGGAGEKMKKALERSGQLMSNGLAMIDNLSSVFSSFGGIFSRRLLSDGTSSSPPSFVDANARRFMAAVAPLKPNVVVAQDGSGQFKTITAAINTLPAKNNQTFVIHVKAGVYKESVEIPRHVDYLVLVGDGPLKTRIVGNKNYIDGVQTFHTAVLAVNGENFLAKDIGIENTAGPTKHQAVAVRVSGDKSIFQNVHMDGFQDTLYSHNYRQFYRDCQITGTIDFIFGDAAAVFQNCRLVVRKPMDNQACMVTAQGRKDKRSVGITLLQNCNIAAEPALLSTKPPVKVYLGRPWKEYSRTIVMQSNIDGFIDPEGWSPWQGTFALDTLYYGEYQNRGPGSDLSKRVTWKGIQKITPQLAESFTAAKVYLGDEWVKSSGVPYDAGMMKV